VDNQGNVWITGRFSGTVNFGAPTGLSTANSASDAFLASYSPAGAYISAQRFGGAGGELGLRMDVDGSGALCVGAEISSATNFGGGVLTPSSQSMGIARFTAAGNHIWSKVFEASPLPGYSGRYASPRAVASAGGSVWMAGNITGSVNFGGGALAGVGDVGAAALVELAASDSSHLFSRRYGGAGGASSTGVAVDVDRVFLCGGFAGVIEFGAFVLTSMGLGDGYCVALARP
jgi:hypothetical protein